MRELKQKEKAELAGAQEGGEKELTEMNWLKEQEERIESSIKMHENCLIHAKEELDALRKIINRLEGQSNNMNRPKNQS